MVSPSGATAVTHGPTRFLASILSIFDEHQSEVLVLGQNGSDLIFRPRLLGRNARLQSPAIRLANLIPVEAWRFGARGRPPGRRLAFLRGLAGSRMASLEPSAESQLGMDVPASL